MSGFFEELKRRKVYRVAIAYAVGSWALAQGLAQVLPVFDISNSVIRGVIALLLIGFPVALVLAWVFDVTPQGIKATPTIAAPGSHRRRNVMMLVATGVIISAAAGFFLLPRASARKIDKSIAVLPFENLSDEKGNAYFADGIQDDILTNLSKIGDLKVISRTSVMPYRGHTSNIREIAKTLGVSSVLEGSVRREGNRVRVNVQLINANNDEHLWANNYDRDLTDVFAIQTDLAREIAGALQAKLSPTEKAQMERKPTENGEAYLAFLQAHTLFFQSMEDLEKLKQAEQLYERAIQLDPKFALAFARWSQLESWLVHSFERTAERRKKRAHWRSRLCNYSPTCRRRISLWDFRSITATTISRERSKSSKSHSAVCLTRPRVISPSGRSSAAWGNGRNRTPVSRKQPFSIRKTVGCFKISLSVTRRCAISGRLVKRSTAG